MSFLTIVLPSYNSAKTIALSLNSIINQSFQDFQILIIDGVSTDETISIVKGYAEKDDRISWISEYDKGIYDAMNKGVRLAKGKWIYFLGSDDTLFDRNVLANVFANDEVFTFDVIYGNVISSRFDGRYDGEFDPRKLFDKNICHQAIFFNKNIFEKVGKFNIKYKSHADWDHNLKWFLNKKIKKKYLPYDIANYGDGGFSSLNNDTVFIKDKRFNYIKYGFNSLSNKLLWRLAYFELKKAYKMNYFEKIPFVFFVYLKSKFFYKILKLD